MSRSTIRQWLIDQSSPLVLNTSADNLGFVGKYRPSGKEVLLQFYGYHKIKPEEPKGTSSKRESYNLVVEDIEKSWKKTEIGLKSREAIIYMVKKLKVLLPNENRII